MGITDSQSEVYGHFGATIKAKAVTSQTVIAGLTGKGDTA
jgi:hypothetical protein